MRACVCGCASVCAGMVGVVSASTCIRLRRAPPGSLACPAVSSGLPSSRCSLPPSLRSQAGRWSPHESARCGGSDPAWRGAWRKAGGGNVREGEGAGRQVCFSASITYQPDVVAAILCGGSMEETGVRDGGKAHVNERFSTTSEALSTSGMSGKNTRYHTLLNVAKKPNRWMGKGIKCSCFQVRSSTWHVLAVCSIARSLQQTTPLSRMPTCPPAHPPTCACWSMAGFHPPAPAGPWQGSTHLRLLVHGWVPPTCACWSMAGSHPPAPAGPWQGSSRNRRR